MASKNRMSINHAAGIYADMSVDGPAIGTLVAVVDRAKNLPNRKTMGKQNPYCAARLGKEAKKTETDLRGGQTPRWDQELRFTIHESPDYFRMKVSVFNDDKRTDLIGETWVDLKDLIIPGGGQSDQWHPLQHRGKYAGEIRLEMTYYDTRPEDEAVIERRTLAAEKIHAKSGGSAPLPGSNSNSVSGPRQLKDIKRRPLPNDPSGAPVRPPPPEKLPSAPAPVPVQPPARPVAEHAYSTPPAEYARHSRQPVPDAPYDAGYAAPPVGRPMRTYETPDDFQREWSAPPVHAPIPVHLPAQVLPAMSRRHQEMQHPSPRERADSFDSRSYARPQSGYNNMPPADFRSMRQEPPRGPDPYAQEPMDEAPRPNSHHGNYPFSSTEQYMPSTDVSPYGRFSQYAPRGPPMLEYRPEEPDHGYRSHSNSLVRDNGVMHSPSSRDGYHAEYATMQPRVDDEEEEGPPPPPPVHRSGVVGSNQQLVPSLSSSYQAYSPEYAPSPRTSTDINRSLASDAGRLQDLPPHTNGPSMPPSLVAGFDPIIADDETDRAVYEGQARRRSAIFEEPEPAVIPPPYPEDLPQPADDRRSIISRGSMNSSDSRLVPRRKSVSPRPPSSREPEPSQIPFSPDSYDAFNPNASRSSLIREPLPAYDSPSQSMDAARRSGREADREHVPIIGDDGREINPSDHLPMDTWAPEPERKTPKKPGVVVRFRNAPARNNPAPPVATKEFTWKSAMADRGRVGRPQSSYMGAMEPVGRVSPGDQMDRGRPLYGHGRTYSSPNAPPPPRSPRGSVSPGPRGPSPSNFYAPPSPGPPIPAKVPVAAPVSSGYPVKGSGMGMDALSRELNSIDIGEVGFNTGRATKRYVPRLTMGYAS